MARKNIYVPDDLAAELAEYEDFPLSAICQEAIRKELHMLQAVETHQDMERIEVDVEDAHGSLRTLAFTGRWLVAPDSDATRTAEPGYDAGAYWGIALTAKGRIAVYTAHCNRDGGFLSDYDDLPGAEADRVPADMIAEAIAELTGTVPVIELDI